MTGGDNTLLYERCTDAVSVEYLAFVLVVGRAGLEPATEGL